MVFSSSIFLFAFLPLVLLLYFNPLNRASGATKLFALCVAGMLGVMYFSPEDVPVSWILYGAVVLFGLYLCKDWINRIWNSTERSTRNLVLLIFSLAFYAWGEPKYILLLLFSILLNYGMGLWVGKYPQKTMGKWLVGATVLANVAIFFYFKYMTFVFTELNEAFSLNLPLKEVVLPIGISFYTFQALSYVVDVYRGEVKSEKNPLKVGLYIALFPQLIAGPIVRYNTIAAELTDRKETWDDFSAGAVRFTTGLAKKMVLANPCGYIADMAFNAPQNEQTVLLCWMGAIAYTFQIYFDFSGYSDMAIGLGRMFGFHFLENFNFPYIAKGITDFWRRWHISLSTWFRDYVYIPLGGNRSNSKMRVLFNLFLVWLLTGVWHGANWTFLCWGLFYFVLLMIERLTGLNKNPRFFCYLYTLPCVIAAWVLFRAKTITEAWHYLKTMCGLTDAPLFAPYNIFVLGEYAPFLILGTLFSLPILPALNRQNFYLDKIGHNGCRVAAEKTLTVAKFASIMFVFLLAVSFVVKSTNNPFIYFNF